MNAPIFPKTLKAPARLVSPVAPPAPAAPAALTAGQWAILPTGTAGEAWVYLPSTTAWASATNLQYSINDGLAQSLGVTVPGAYLITGLTDGDTIQLRRVATLAADWSDSKTFSETVDAVREATVFADVPANERPAPGGMTIVAAGVDATAATAAKAAYDALLPITGGISSSEYQDGIDAAGLEQPLNLTNGTQVSIGSDGRLSITPSAAQAAADPLTAGVVTDTAGLIEEGSGVDLYSNGAMGTPDVIDANWTAGAGTPPSTLTSDGTESSGMVRWNNVSGITAGDEITFRWDMTRTQAGIKWLIIPDTGFVDAVSGPYDDVAGTGKELTLTAPAGTSFQLRVQSSASFIGELSNISITVGGFSEETLTLRVLPALGLHTWVSPSVTHNLAQFLFDAPRTVGWDVTGRPFIVGETSVWNGSAWISLTSGDVASRGAGRLACVEQAGQILPETVTVTL